MGMLNHHLFAKLNKISPLTRKPCKGASFCDAEPSTTATTLRKRFGLSAQLLRPKTKISRYSLEQREILSGAYGTRTRDPMRDRHVF